MSRAHAALALAAAACLAAGSAWARDPTAAERAALATTVERFAAAARAGDSEGVVSVMPPRLLDSLASRKGLDGATLRSAVKALDANLRAAGVREVLSFDLRHARFASLPDGMLYGLIPSRVTVTPNGGRAMSTSGRMLALLEGSGWYLVDIGDEANRANLKQAYPAFASVDFGRKTLGMKP